MVYSHSSARPGRVLARASFVLELRASAGIQSCAYDTRNSHVVDVLHVRVSRAIANLIAKVPPASSYQPVSPIS